MAPRKLYKSGNSIVVSIPEQLLKALEIEAGSKVHLLLRLDEPPHPVPIIMIRKAGLDETKPT